MNREQMQHDYRSALEQALQLCRGHYQRAIVTNQARLSGSDLKGTASKYSGRYRESIHNLLKRMRKAGVPNIEVPTRNGRRVLILGDINCRLAEDAHSAWVREQLTLRSRAERTESNKTYHDKIDEILSTQKA